MTALVLSEDFTSQAITVAQRLLVSKKKMEEMEDPRGYFVAVLGTPLPDRSVQIASFHIDDREFIIFTHL